jgi:hypothetical protein
MNINDLVPYALASVPAIGFFGLVAASCFYLSLKRQGKALAEQAAANAETLERMGRVLDVLSSYGLENLDKRLAEVESRKPVIISEAGAASPVAGSRRGQMLRLRRSGESAAGIAESLGVSQGEVNLTLKLQDMFAQMTP